MSIFELVTSRKDFGTRWVGSPQLNRLGLHVARMQVTDLLLGARRRQVSLGGARGRERDLLRDGIVVWRDFLPVEVFQDVRTEAQELVAALEHTHPAPRPEGNGFGRKLHRPTGFDRFDGSTLNRFVAIRPNTTPACFGVARDPKLARLLSFAGGFRARPERFYLYQTIFGSEAERERWGDYQADVHRDTFHSTIKLWLYLDDVAVEDGAFRYAPGSHRLTAERRRWEMANAIYRAGAPAWEQGGAFRSTDQEVEALGYEPMRSYPVAANTLVLADTRGFHARGAARGNARRLAIYASSPRWPFSPLAV